MGWDGLNSSGSGQESVEGSCELCKESSSSINCLEYCSWLEAFSRRTQLHGESFLWNSSCNTTVRLLQSQSLSVRNLIRTYVFLLYLISVTFTQNKMTNFDKLVSNKAHIQENSARGEEPTELSRVPRLLRAKSRAILYPQITAREVTGRGRQISRSGRGRMEKGYGTFSCVVNECNIIQFT